MNVLRKGMKVLTAVAVGGFVLASNVAHADLTAATSSGLSLGILGIPDDPMTTNVNEATGVHEIVGVVEKFRETIFLPLVILLLGISLAIMMYRRITTASGSR